MWIYKKRRIKCAFTIILNYKLEVNPESFPEGLF